MFFRQCRLMSPKGDLLLAVEEDASASAPLSSSFHSLRYLSRLCLVKQKSSFIIMMVIISHILYSLLSGFRHIFIFGQLFLSSHHLLLSRGSSILIKSNLWYHFFHQ